MYFFKNTLIEGLDIHVYLGNVYLTPFRIMEVSIKLHTTESGGPIVYIEGSQVISLKVSYFFL